MLDDEDTKQWKVHSFEASTTTQRNELESSEHVISLTSRYQGSRPRLHIPLNGGLNFFYALLAAQTLKFSLILLLTFVQLLQLWFSQIRKSSPYFKELQNVYPAMSVVSLLGVRVLNNPTSFSAPYEFEITFECLEQLQKGELLSPFVLSSL